MMVGPSTFDRAEGCS